jgi:hypothetical protein
MDTSALAQRQTWDPYPLSVATSLAILGGMGVHPDHPLPPGQQPLLKYEEVWVNVKTLFRNLYEAVDKASVDSIPVSAFADTLLEEMEQFVNIIADLSNRRIAVQFYICDYKDLARTYPHAILRGDTTDNQRRYTHAMSGTLALILKTHRDHIHVYPLKITHASTKKLLLLTHYPIDLFSVALQRRALWESHTGTIKEKHQWYTKLLSKDLPMIPFSEAMMQIFGDKEHFRPMSMAIKKQVLELAERYNWSQVTTEDKMKYGISTLRDHAVRDMLRSLF